MNRKYLYVWISSQTPRMWRVWLIVIVEEAYYYEKLSIIMIIMLDLVLKI